MVSAAQAEGVPVMLETPLPHAVRPAEALTGVTGGASETGVLARPSSAAAARPEADIMV